MFLSLGVRNGWGATIALGISICSFVQLSRDVSGLWKEISHNPLTCVKDWKERNMCFEHGALTM